MKKPFNPVNHTGCLSDYLFSVLPAVRKQRLPFVRFSLLMFSPLMVIITMMMIIIEIEVAVRVAVIIVVIWVIVTIPIASVPHAA
jgi:hypothetical protein